MTTQVEQKPALSSPTASRIAKLWRPVTVRVDYLYIILGVPVVVAGLLVQTMGLPVDTANRLTLALWFVGGLLWWRGAYLVTRYWSQRQGLKWRFWVFWSLALVGSMPCVIGGTVLVAALAAA